MPQVLTAVKFVQKLRQSAEILCHCLISIVAMSQQGDKYPLNIAFGCHLFSEMQTQISP